MLYRVRQINYMPKEIQSILLEFIVDDQVVGKIHPTTATMLCDMKNKAGQSVFIMANSDSDNGKEYLTLSSDIDNNFNSRTHAVGEIMNLLKDDGLVKGWRDELFPVGTSFYSPPLFLIERATVPLFGILEYGVHINGIVRSGNDSDDNELKMWIGRRSSTKSKFPNMLDHIVAGGQPAGLSLLENVIKECYEEAGIPKDLTLKGLRPAGAISYETYSEGTSTNNGNNGNTNNNGNNDTDMTNGISKFGKISRVVLFNFDLYLPEDFVPTPTDGEVQEFQLWNINQIKQSMSPTTCKDPIKPNCYVVIIDFLLRHGYINPDVPGYLDILRELRSGDCL